MNNLKDILADEGLLKKAAVKFNFELYDDHQASLRDLVEAFGGDWARVMVSLGGSTKVEIGTDKPLEAVLADPKAARALQHMKRSFGAGEPNQDSWGMISITFYGR